MVLSLLSWVPWLYLPPVVQDEQDAPVYADEWEWVPEEESEEHLSWISRFRHRTNSLLALDIVSTGVGATGVDGVITKQAIGLDYYRTFGRYDQWGELVLQAYALRIDNFPDPPSLFDDGNDWEFVWKTANFNYTGFGDDRLKIRVGHFDIPYGLEHLLDTNLGLEQTIAAQNLGSKRDWGVSVNGTGADYDYELALLRGSGLRYEDDDGPVAVAGRLGSDRSANQIFGISGYFGDALTQTGVDRIQLFDLATGDSSDTILRRSRIGLDYQQFFGNWALQGEASAGEDEGLDVANFFAAMKWDPLESDWQAWTQIRALNQRSDGWRDNISVVAGMLYSPAAKWSIGLQVAHDLTRFDDGDEVTAVSLQVRFRY